MSRRAFFHRAAGIVAAAAGAAAAGAPARGRIAITIDDPGTEETPLLEARARDACMREALRCHGLRAVLFVCGKRVDGPAGRTLLDAWEADGHALGNHSYSHDSLNRRAMTVEAFGADIVAGERLLSGRSTFARLFRFPFLREGNTPHKRDALRAFLRERRYRNGHVTVDASDWYVDQRLRKRLEASPGADTGPFRDYYLEHILDRVAYYDGLARAVLGRSVAHTLLLHHNLLNALHLGDLLHGLDAGGFQLVDGLAAYDDPVFRREPDVVPAGESLLWSLAKEAGLPGLRYPAEDAIYEEAAMVARGL